jgi:hypothetical protein
MKFTFTEGDYEGAYRFGGQLEIKAENPQEVEDLISHFRLFKNVSDVAELQRRIEALQSQTLVHVLKSDKRPIYEVSGCLDHEFTKPYQKWAKDCFGFDGVFPDLEIPRKYDGLIHTNYQARLYTENEHICFEAYTSAQPWAGKDAQDYATNLVTDYIGEEFGCRYQEPEFLSTRNGMFTKNPNYLKRHKAKPGATNSRLKKAFFNWWLATHANDAQKAIVQGNQEIAKGANYMNAFGFERFESRIYYEHTGKDYKSVTFAEFAALA